MQFINMTKNSLIGADIKVANTSFTRLVGLIGRKKLEPGTGLYITPSSGVHTFGMSFPIDVVALNRKQQVVKLWHRLPPFRLTSVSLKVHSVLELPAGEIGRCRIDVGDQLVLS